MVILSDVSPTTGQRALALRSHQNTTDHCNNTFPYNEHDLNLYFEDKGFQIQSSNVLKFNYFLILFFFLLLLQCTVQFVKPVYRHDPKMCFEEMKLQFLIDL